AMPWAGGGCGEASLFSVSTWDPMGVRFMLDLHNKPVTIGLCHEQKGVFDITHWGEKPPWDAFRKRLQEHLHRPVRFENFEPFQIGFHLDQTGRIDFALLNAADYVKMTEEGTAGKILAISQRRLRQGVIVANAKSDIQSPADLKGRNFAFGPKNDPVLHLAALSYLQANGVDAKDLRSPVLGGLQHHISSKEAAKQIAYVLGTDAGVVEAEDYDAWPETGGRWFPLPETFSKDQFRVLGRTEKVVAETIGEGPFLVGEHVDDELVQAMRAFLIEADRKNRRALNDLGFSGFRAAPADADHEIRKLAATAPTG
ncbi:MAG: phosphate/phosphite/phosphonate ABC transporter substrate-binding protein, partial [Phycisphaerae bacterium]